MRILYVCSDFGVPVYGHKGASIHLRAMARAFAECGHDIRIVSPAIEPDANQDFDVPVSSPIDMAPFAPALGALRRTDRALGVGSSGHSARVGQEVRNLLYNQALGAAIEIANGFDCIYERYALFGHGGLDLARRTGLPHVLEVNAPLCAEQSRVRGLHLTDVGRAIEDRVWRETDAVLAVSEEIAALARDRGAVAQRVHVLANGVDAARFEVERAAARARVCATWDLDDGPIIGFVGSLKPWHGTDVLVDAFARLQGQSPRLQLLVVGDGPEAAALQAQVHTRGIASRVRFTGAVEHARVPELVAAMDVAAAPYRAASDFYFSPIKVYEYLAAGTPVVASPLGQITALIEAGHVSAATPGDAADLAAALARVLDAPQAALAAAAKGRTWTLQERTWTANARRVAAIFDGVAETTARMRT